MDVRCKSLLLSVAFATLLSGCEEPSVSVSSLGRKLAAPVLTSSSPFDQDMNTQGYVRVTGTCDKRVGPVTISFDDSTYHSAPSSVTIAGSAKVNDNDCSDGKFDIYLTSADVLSIWGVDTNDDNNNVSNIYIKGETIFGDTRPLIITDPKANDPSQSSGRPTKISLEKIFPSGFGAINQCEMFNVVVLDANYNQTSARDPITFQIANSTGTSIAIYQSANDCASYYNSLASVTIPVSTSNKTIYMKMPAAPIDGTVEFSLANISSTTAITAASPSTPVVLRDPTSSRRFISVTDSPSTFYKNTCYPLSLQRLDYYKSSPYSSSALTVTVNPSVTNFEIFADSDCNTASKTSTIQFTSGITKKTVYAKYSSTGTSTVSFTGVTFNYTTNDSNYDTPSYFFRVDLSDKTAVAHFDFWGPNSLTRNSCSPYTAVTANNNWTPVPADKDYTVNLAYTLAGMSLQFYSDASCSTALSSNSFVISQGQVGAKVYAKSSGSLNANGQIVASVSGFSSITRDFTFSAIANNVIVSMDTSFTITKNACTYIKFEYVDQMGATLDALNPIQLAFQSVSGSGNLVKIYADENCTTPYAENVAAPLNPYSATIYKFYIKVDPTYSQSSLQLLFSTTAGFTTSPYNANFNILTP